MKDQLVETVVGQISGSRGGRSQIANLTETFKSSRVQELDEFANKIAHITGNEITDDPDVTLNGIFEHFFNPKKECPIDNRTMMEMIIALSGKDVTIELSEKVKHQMMNFIHQNADAHLMRNIK